MKKRHVQLPNDADGSGITPRDKLIYLSIRRFMDEKTRAAHPSYATISKVCGMSINTVIDSIKVLSKCGYFRIEDCGRGHRYVFKDLDSFEPFSYDFLDNQNLTPVERSCLIAMQQRMYTDVCGYGKISYSNRELAKQINVSEATLSRVNRSLERKNYLTILKNGSRDIETGCYTDTKIYHLDELGQSVIWALRSHEERLNKVDKDVDELKRENREMKKMLDALMRERNVEPEKYVMK